MLELIIRQFQNVFIACYGASGPENNQQSIWKKKLAQQS